MQGQLHTPQENAIPSRWLAFALLFTACVIASGAEPPGYYNAASGLSGAALRSALHTIIRTGYTSVGYNNSDEAMLVTDQSPNDSTRVTLIYSRRQELKIHFIGNGNPTPNPPTAGWNREHQWPDSLGIDGNEPMYSDLFNLRPADVDVNSDRGNLYYDESTTGTGYQNPAHAEATLCTQDSNSWEPPAEVKGDIARSMLYMDLRYEGDAGESNLQLTDNTALINTSAAYMGRLSTLLVWHFLDPVSDAERLRNDLVYPYQHNRNPFIDHPEWVEALYGPVFQIQLTTASSTQATLRWPSQIQTTMYEIRSSTDLVNWQTVTLTPTVSGQWRNATVTFTPDRKFYALRLLAPAG